MPPYRGCVTLGGKRNVFDGLCKRSTQPIDQTTHHELYVSTNEPTHHGFMDKPSHPSKSKPKPEIEIEFEFETNPLLNQSNSRQPVSCSSINGGNQCIDFAEIVLLTCQQLHDSSVNLMRPNPQRSTMIKWQKYSYMYCLLKNYNYLNIYVPLF